MDRFITVNGTQVAKAKKLGHFLLRAGALFDGMSEYVVHNQDVEICDGVIVAVKERGSFEESIPIVDCSNWFVMPGLIEAHLHLSGMQTPEPYKRYFESSDLRLIRALRHAEILLSNGFTTVRELGGKGRGVSLRSAIDKGLMEGPRILSSIEYLSPTAGHGDWPVLPYDFVKETSLRSILVDGVDDCILAVRKLLREKADFVKIVTSTGGFGQTYETMQFRPCFSEREIRAMVEEAHNHGVRVASHSVGSIGIRRAVECGIDTIEHCFFNYDKDPELLDLLFKSKVVIVPTLCIIYWFGEWEEKHGNLANAENFYNNLEHHQRFVKAAYDAGIPIACGTDETGMHGVGRSCEEYVFMSKAGIPNDGILRGATSIAAKALGIQEVVGSIEPGKVADLLVLKRCPTENIEVLKDRNNIVFVMQGG